MKIKNKVLYVSLVTGALLLGAASVGASEVQTETETEITDASLIFSTEDINEEEYTQEIFENYDLTLVNVFATWCTPCIQEIPDLEELSQSVSEQNVNVVGILLDGADLSGAPDSEAIEKAKLLAEKTGATYPFLLPDTTFLNGYLFEIQAIPYTFFVDSEGNIVGDAYEGSRDFNTWMDVVEAELNRVKEKKAEN